MDFLSLVAMVVFVLSFLAAVDLLLGFARMQKLGSVERCNGTNRPQVSIIVPACNEEDSIGRALRSQLQQDYTHLEIVAVNDRSSDCTPDILEKLQQQDPRL
ncbi:MAG TPA: glycosyltransferase, partial [Desulfopila sp.]|nr:glycosyltransferase [Desulfopila sp.]